MTHIDQSQQLLDLATRHYLNSNDFNGLPLREIETALGTRIDESRKLLSYLIGLGRISLNFGDRHPNPYIMALPPDSDEDQQQKLAERDLFHVCAYPTRAHLAEVVDRHDYDGRPFTLMLALGEPQLAYRAFYLAILEFYRNDPRYYYTSDDITGSISVHDEYFQTGSLKASDETVLQSFGFAFNEELQRAVAVLLRYLSDLSAEHQQIWRARMLGTNYRLHPDYYRSAIVGDWYQGISIFDAFLEEQRHINAMCGLMKRRPLFRNTYDAWDKPKSFSFLLRPTTAEYHAFVHLLDKMISDNLNRDFFGADIAFEYDEPRKDGKIIVKQKGTLQALDEWLGRSFRTSDREPLDDMLRAFRLVRRERQRPAHAVDRDVFDQECLARQRQLMIDVYGGVRTLRLIFANHPSVQGYEVPEPLRSGRHIWPY